MKPLYSVLASTFIAYLNCEANGNFEWEGKHKDRINELVKNLMPGGSGFDNGTKLSWTDSKPERLVFIVDVHHMDEHGSYDCWTSHTVIVTPSLAFEFNIRVTGKNYNEIKDYIAETFETALRIEV